MNLLNKCSKKDIELMKQAGVVLEDKDYSSEQLERCEQEIIDYIMSHSSKNNEIDKLRDKYSGIFRIIENK